MRIVRKFNTNVRLQPGPVLLPNPREFEFLFIRHGHFNRVAVMDTAAGFLRSSPSIWRVPQHCPWPNRCQSSLLTLVSGVFLFSGSCPADTARTLAVPPANSGAMGSRRPGKTQFMAQARPGCFFALAHGTRGLMAERSIACHAAKRRSNSTVKLGTAILLSTAPGPWSACSANWSPCGWR